jgi:hypothetical protein
MSLCHFTEEHISIPADTGVMVDIDNGFLARHRCHRHREANTLPQGAQVLHLYPANNFRLACEDDGNAILGIQVEID